MSRLTRSAGSLLARAMQTHRTMIEMRKALAGSVLSLSFATGAFATGVLAAESQPATTVRTEKEMVKNLLKDETFSFKPLLGALAYTDSQGNSAGRAAFGLMLDFNVMTLGNSRYTQTFFGPALGIIASHLGDPGSNGFGANSGQALGQSGSNLLLLPLDLKLGYAFTDYYRIGVHAGANGVYRSSANAMNLGEGSDSADSLWKLYPNIGADLDIALSPRVALTLRPDWTLGPQNDLFAGTLGVGIFLD